MLQILIGLGVSSRFFVADVCRTHGAVPRKIAVAPLVRELLSPEQHDGGSDKLGEAVEVGFPLRKGGLQRAFRPTSSHLKC